MPDDSRMGTLRTFAVGVAFAILGSGVGLLAGGLLQDPQRVSDLLFRDTDDALREESHSSTVPEEPFAVVAAAQIQDDLDIRDREFVAPPMPNSATSPIPDAPRPVQ